jgi:ABC-type branched-subunit amino acid transport system ATPase component
LAGSRTLLYSFDGLLLVCDLSFQVVTSQLVIIMGPNGKYVPISSISSILYLFIDIVVKASTIHS